MSKLLLAALVASVGPVLTISGAFAHVGPVKTDTSDADAVVVNQNDASFTVARRPVTICLFVRGELRCF